MKSNVLSELLLISVLPILPACVNGMVSVIKVCPETKRRQDVVFTEGMVAVLFRIRRGGCAVRLPVFS
jgi:hypothetical protein